MYVLVCYQTATKPESNRGYALRVFSNELLKTDALPRLHRWTKTMEFTKETAGGRRQKYVMVEQEIKA